jgi:hypothetical protein
LRSGSPAEAERILDSIAADVEKGTGFHGWLWRDRVGVARGELDLVRGDFASALRRAEVSIAKCRKHRRLKYETAARVVHASALAGLGRTDDAVHGLVQFLGDLAPACDPAIRLRASTAVLAHTRDERARDIAIQAATAIESGLPTADRAAFRARVPGLG